MTTTCCVIVRDPVPDGLAETLRRRSGDVPVAPGRGHLECLLSDEASVRGLLTAIWDAGPGVLALLRGAAVPAEGGRSTTHGPPPHVRAVPGAPAR